MQLSVSKVFLFHFHKHQMTDLLSWSIPPLSVVGLSEEQTIQQANGDILVFTSSLNPLKNTVSGCALVI
ncbi:hypothetical protein SLEP1_g43553 [Rubroshorea leprosula]|uniref:Uncharacterized protein n=1 Tax=Rubroshorea leprosula TaxID=152421 RepID=A0AAV5LDU4_9ROSI|nr:hypothetical protein SLEP1_g43553 [Rubroshorea leprosula]